MQPLRAPPQRLAHASIGPGGIEIAVAALQAATTPEASIGPGGIEIVGLAARDAGKHQASIGPGGIEILNGHIAGDIQLCASIGPGGIEITKRLTRTALGNGLQSDQVELKLYILSQQGKRLKGFNRTRWN